MRLSDLQQRLDLLVDGGVVSREAAKMAKAAAVRLKSKGRRNPCGEKLNALVTHLAVALTRSQTEEDVIPPSPEVMGEITASVHYREAQKEVEWLSRQWRGALSEGEKQYLFIHFVTVLQDGDKGGSPE